MNRLFSDFLRKLAGVILGMFPTIWGSLTRLTRLTRLFKIALNRLSNDQGVRSSQNRDAQLCICSVGTATITKPKGTA